MQLELVIVVSSMILYSLKCYRLNSYKKKFENGELYTLNDIVIHL
jgi:hypothetical protein